MCWCQQHQNRYEGCLLMNGQWIPNSSQNRSLSPSRQFDMASAFALASKRFVGLVAGHSASVGHGGVEFGTIARVNGLSAKAALPLFKCTSRLRYRAMAETLGLEGLRAWAEEMPRRPLESSAVHVAWRATQSCTECRSDLDCRSIAAASARRCAENVPGERLRRLPVPLGLAGTRGFRPYAEICLS